MTIDFLSEAHKLFDYTRSMRRDFHRHPELGFQERRTSQIVAAELNALGLKVRSGIAETGVVALLEPVGAAMEKTVMLRFDMDALPITEENTCDYASQNPGVMHACGHDGHTAIGLSVARLLHKHRSELPGRVMFVFQPAEEAFGGAQRMVIEGVLNDPRPDYALGLHLWNHQPVGWLGITPGAVMAAVEFFYVTIHGKGGHGARPEDTRDPIFASAQVISALQSIVSRNVSALKSAVVSVTMIRGGETTNVIPPSVDLRGTIRSFDPQVRQVVMTRFSEIVNGVTQALGCQAQIEFSEPNPAVVNDAEVTRRVQSVAARLFPKHHLATDFATTGSEDMAFFLKEVPGCFFFVGSANSAKGLDFGHHHPRYDFDEDVLPQAVALMSAAAFEVLG